MASNFYLLTNKRSSDQSKWYWSGKRTFKGNLCVLLWGLCATSRTLFSPTQPDGESEVKSFPAGLQFGHTQYSQQNYSDGLWEKWATQQLNFLYNTVALIARWGNAEDWPAAACTNTPTTTLQDNKLMTSDLYSLHAAPLSLPYRLWISALHGYAVPDHLISAEL